MADSIQIKLSTIEVLDDLSRAFLKLSDALHDCASELSNALAEEYTEQQETKQLAEVKPVQPKKPRTLPGRTGLFDTKRIRDSITIKFASHRSPTTFATFKRLGMFLTGVTPRGRLFTLPHHIDTGEQYIRFVKEQISRLVQEHRPDLGGVDWVSRTTSDDTLLKA